MQIRVVSNTGRLLAIADIAADYIPYLSVQEKVLYQNEDSVWCISWKDYSKFVYDALEL